MDTDAVYVPVRGRSLSPLAGFVRVSLPDDVVGDELNLRGDRGDLCPIEPPSFGGLRLNLLRRLKSATLNSQITHTHVYRVE